MNKSTRFKEHSGQIYDCYCEIELPVHRLEESPTPQLIDFSDDPCDKIFNTCEFGGGSTTNNSGGSANNNSGHKQPRITRRYPHSFKDEEILKTIPQFAYPCPLDIVTVTHFSFVLTNVASKWTFGYCRLAPNSNTCFVILSHLPWHDTFFKIINQVALLSLNKDEPHVLIEFLRCLYTCEVPTPGASISIAYMSSGKTHEFSAKCPDTSLLPSIPQDRNLTEYYNAIDIDSMIAIFASMLNERRILVTSRRLDRLSSCVQAANSLIYPMHWQHIFIPVLPTHLLEYLSAPMPFLIGVPEQTLNTINIGDLGEVVILYADKNLVESPFDDMQTIPVEILQNIRRHLRGPVTIGDSVSRAFVKALVILIGGYRDALQYNEEEKKVTFNFDKFVKTRPPTLQPFMERMLHLQIFLQFIEERLDILNAGEGYNDQFEYEVDLYDERSANNSKIQYQEWLTAMKNGGRLLRSLNPAVRLAYKNVRDRGKRAINDLRVKINDGSQPRPSFVYHRFI